jgi:hypothetical protein
MLNKDFLIPLLDYLKPKDRIQVEEVLNSKTDEEKILKGAEIRKQQIQKYNYNETIIYLKAFLIWGSIISELLFSKKLNILELFNFNDDFLTYKNYTVKTVFNYKGKTKSLYENLNKKLNAHSDDLEYYREVIECIAPKYNINLKKFHSLTKVISELKQKIFLRDYLGINNNTQLNLIFNLYGKEIFFDKNNKPLLEDIFIYPTLRNANRHLKWELDDINIKYMDKYKKYHKILITDFENQFLKLRTIIQAITDFPIFLISDIIIKKNKN